MRRVEAGPPTIEAIDATLRARARRRALAHIGWGVLLGTFTLAALDRADLPPALVALLVATSFLLSSGIGVMRVMRSLSRRRRVLEHARRAAESADDLPSPASLLDTNELPAFSAEAVYRRHST